MLMVLAAQLNPSLYEAPTTTSHLNPPFFIFYFLNFNQVWNMWYLFYFLTKCDPERVEIEEEKKYT